MSSRNFCFTLNNYTEDEVEHYKNIQCRYIQFGKEIASTGTPHLQGFIIFKSVKTLSAAIKCLPRSHVEICKGSAEQNMAYTGKDGDVFKKGDPPKTQEECGKRGEAYWQDIKKKMEERRDDELPAAFTVGQFPLYEKLRAKRARTAKLQDVVTKHLWFYGKTRTGKSRRAREIAEEKAPNEEPYRKKQATKWWCGYEEQKVVIIEEMAPKYAYQLEEFKEWTDRYPFPAEKKSFGQITIRPELIIVTSNYSIEQIWPDPEENEPILERFDQVKFTK